MLTGLQVCQLLNTDPFHALDMSSGLLCASSAGTFHRNKQTIYGASPAVSGVTFKLLNCISC